MDTTTQPKPAFKPKMLDTRTLTASIDKNLSQNAHLVPERDRTLIAQTYEKYRNQIGPMLLETDFEDISLLTYVEILGDMMSLVKSFKGVPNRHKKELILEVIDLVIEHECPPEQHAKLRKILNNTISPAIDLAAYYVKQIKPKCKKAFACCRS